MPVSRVSAARRSMSPAPYMVAVGLCGVLMMIMRVRGESAAATASQSTLNPCGDSLMPTGLAPCSRTIGA
jgi:hypothetical protein